MIYSPAPLVPRISSQIKGIPSLSVDNLSWEFHAELLKSAIQVVS